jgi:hypothetical protein
MIVSTETWQKSGGVSAPILTEMEFTLRRNVPKFANKIPCRPI